MRRDTRPALLRWGFLLLFPLILPLPALSQGLDEDLGRLAGENAELYVRPVTDGLGFAIAGTHTGGARVLRAFGFDLGLRVSAALPSPESESFLAVLPDSLTWDHPVLGGTFHDPFRPSGGSSQATPSAVGDGEGLILEPNGEFRSRLIAAGEDPGEYEIRFPDGQRIRAVPFATLSATVGLGFGTEVGVRFVPAVEVDPDIGRLSSTGFQLRHEITHWMPASPLDVSALIASQSIEVGDYMDAESRQYGLIFGRSAGPLSLFGSGVLRTATVDVNYTVSNSSENPGLPSDGEVIRLSHELDRGVALGAGAHLSLLFMNVSGAYTWDEYGVVSLKVGFGRP
jgi:hypothetical protein